MNTPVVKQQQQVQREGDNPEFIDSSSDWSGNDPT